MNSSLQKATELVLQNTLEDLREVKRAADEAHSFISCTGESPEAMFGLILQKLDRMDSRLAEHLKVYSIPF